jgi:pimeloyl-ACP methyl ester carboxylesterase
MDPEIAAELAWADAGEQRLFEELTRAQALMSQRLRDAPGSMMGQEASEGDVAFLQRPEVVEAFRGIVAEQARNGVAGSVDDTVAFATDWGFDLGAITVPVLLTWGDADSSCPPSHGRFLAQHVPTAVAFEVPGGGHFADDPRAEVTAVHRWLATGGVPDYPGNLVSTSDN